MEPNLTLITVASILGASGIAFVFVGTLVTMLVALGNKQYIFGAFIFLCFPVGLVYWYFNRRNSAYGGRLLLAGVILFGLFVAVMWWELSRLGLDFFDVMATTRPKH